MEALSETLKSLYGIDEFSQLESLVNKVEDLMIKEDNTDKYALSHVDRLILVGELYSNSIKKLKDIGVKTGYVDPSKLSYKIKNDVITLTDGEHRVTLKKADVSNTLILMRSGYTSQTICYLLDELKEMGFLLLNDVEPVKISSNKYNTAQLLDKNKISQPKFCLVDHNDVSKEDSSSLEDKISKLYTKVEDDTKFVCKILGGHGGKGVFLCTKSNIVSIAQCIFKLNPDTKIIVQEFIPIKEGDIRVNVITLNGKQEIFNVSMRKKVSKDFRTNLSLGNVVDDKYELTTAQKKLALKTAKVSGLVWAGVDILPSEDNDYILEINGVPGPMSDINSDDAEEVNYQFYKKLIETINTLC